MARVGYKIVVENRLVQNLDVLFRFDLTQNTVLYN